MKPKNKTGALKEAHIPIKRHEDADQELPFETMEMRDCLSIFLKTPIKPRHGSTLPNVLPRTLGAVKWGIYAFFDYDDEPIYVGQTNESVGARIGRHLTNQRTDAVAMGVLDPLEVCSVAVWPLPELQAITKNKKAKKDKAAYLVARQQLNSLERAVYDKLLRRSKFKAVLNEMMPSPKLVDVTIPRVWKKQIASDAVSTLRDHPDLRIARRARTIAKLSQVISERKVTKHLRKVLVIQAKRLLWLAERRARSAANLSDKDAD